MASNTIGHARQPHELLRTGRRDGTLGIAGNGNCNVCVTTTSGRRVWGLAIAYAYDLGERVAAASWYGGGGDGFRVAACGCTSCAKAWHARDAYHWLRESSPGWL